MLTPERLVEVNLFVGEHDLEAVTAALMHERALHVEALEGEHWTPAPRWGEAAEVYRALEARLAAAQRSLGLAERSLGGADVPSELATAPRPLDDRAELETVALRLEARLGTFEDELRSAQDDLEELEGARRQLALLQPLAAPVEDLRRLRHVHLTIGTLPDENVDRVAAALFQIAFALVPLERRGGRTLVAVASAREDAFVLDRALRSAFFEPLELPERVRGLPPEALATAEDAAAQARKRVAELEDTREALAQEFGDEAREALARARLDLELCEALRRVPFQDGVYVLAGWMPKARVEAVAERVRAVARDPVVVEALPPAPGRRSVPSLVRNPPWLQPFDVLVTTFGLPGYDELNPTLVTAIVFLFTYGMMFGDLGHGALLALLGLALSRATPFGTVIAAAGAASMVFGALYGVAFGHPVFPALWLQPLHAIFPLLIAAVAAGAVILNLGFVLALITSWRSGDRATFWLGASGVVGLAFYWTLLGGGLAVFVWGLPVPIWLAIAAPLALATWFREPLIERWHGHRASFGGHAVTGFFELFETVISYLSNTLSFIRLGAFAVAHEGLSAMVLQYGLAPGGWGVLLIGTALIVGFEGAIVGIQALRLQYYEFFGRFFQGRGRPFRPLAFAGGSDARTALRP
ncbi:MAG: V-type ATP synthase subunit I [Trueperaceae bacterium]